MLFRSFESMKKEDYNGFPIRGIVVDNEDPDKLGRVKCEVPGRWPINEYDKLPWIFPKNPYGLGGKVTCSSFSVPELGSELIIVFPYKMEYAPFYIGYYQSFTTNQVLLYDESYPNTYGFSDSQMFWVRVNKDEEYLELFHYCGFTARMYDDGNVHINIPKTLTLNIGEDLLVNVDGKEVMEVQGTSSKIVFDDKVLNVKGSNNIICESNEYKSVWGIYSRGVVGTSLFDVTGLQYNNTLGSKTTTASVNYSLEVGVNFEQTVGGYKYIDISGDYKLEVGGDCESTFNSNFISSVIDDYNLSVYGKYKEKVYEDKSVEVLFNNILSVGASNYVKANGDHVEEATNIYMNSGVSLPLPLLVEDPDSPVTSIITSPSLIPSSPIGHGKLLVEKGILLLKVESLQLIDLLMKDLEELAFVIRTQMTSLGPGEYVSQEGTNTPSNVSIFNSDLGAFTTLIQDEEAVTVIQDNLENIDNETLTKLSVEDIEKLQSDLIKNLPVLKSYSIETATKLLSEMLDLIDTTYYSNKDLTDFIKIASNYFVNTFSASVSSKIIKTNIDHTIDNTKITVKINIDLVYNYLVNKNIDSIDISNLSESVKSKVSPTIQDNLGYNLLKTLKSDSIISLSNNIINELLLDILLIVGDTDNISSKINQDVVSNLKSKLDSFTGNALLLKNITRLIKGYDNAKSR